MNLDVKQKMNPEGWRLGNLALIYQPRILAALALVSHERCLCICLNLVSTDKQFGTPVKRPSKSSLITS